jgi:uncharacterized protein (UPF0335 family)
MRVLESRGLGRIFAGNVREVREELQDGHFSSDIVRIIISRRKSRRKRRNGNAENSGI